MSDRYQKVDGADRWFIDIMKTTEPPRFLVLEDVDMTATRELIKRLRDNGIAATYTHVVTRATALALSRNSELVRIILGDKVVHPDSIELSLSVSSDASMSAEPTMILQDSGTKDLVRLSAEIRANAEQVRAEVEQSREQARRLVKIIPSGRARRWLVRRMKTKVSMLRERVGIFHITSLPTLQIGVPLVFGGIGALSVGRVADRVVARDGRPVVAPVATFGLVGDHLVWKATEASIVLGAVKEILESGELAAEVPDPQAPAVRPA